MLPDIMTTPGHLGVQVTTTAGLPQDTIRARLLAPTLDNLLTEDAVPAILENTCLSPDEEVEPFRGYRVLARHERTPWFVNLQTQAVAVASDFDFESLRSDLRGTLSQMIRPHFRLGWHQEFLA